MRNTNGQVSDGYVRRRYLSVDLPVSTEMLRVKTLAGLAPHILRALIDVVMEWFVVLSAIEQLKRFMSYSKHILCQLLNVTALRYKPEGRGFNSRWCHWNFSLT